MKIPLVLSKALGDINFFVVYIYSFGTNVKYSAKKKILKKCFSKELFRHIKYMYVKNLNHRYLLRNSNVQVDAYAFSLTLLNLQQT